METIIYRVGDLTEARNWFNTLLSTNPTHDDADSITYKNIPNQEEASFDLKLAKVDSDTEDSLPDARTHYWIISKTAFRALLCDLSDTTDIEELYLVPDREPNGEKRKKGILNYIYNLDKKSIFIIRKRVGIIVNPNIGILP